MNETTKDKKIRILKALASIPGQTGSIEAIRRKLKPPLDVERDSKIPSGYGESESIIPISGPDYLTFGYTFKGTNVNRVLVAKLADRGQRYFKKIEKHHP